MVLLLAAALLIVVLRIVVLLRIGVRRHRIPHRISVRNIDDRGLIDRLIFLHDVADHLGPPNRTLVADFLLDDRVVVLDNTDVADRVLADDEMVRLLHPRRDRNHAGGVDDPRLVDVLRGVHDLLGVVVLPRLRTVRTVGVARIAEIAGAAAIVGRADDGSAVIARARIAEISRPVQNRTVLCCTGMF